MNKIVAQTIAFLMMFCTIFGGVTLLRILLYFSFEMNEKSTITTLFFSIVITFIFMLNAEVTVTNTTDDED